MDKLLYTRKEAATLLSVSTDTLDVLRFGDKIKGYRIGSRVYIKGADLERYVATMREGETNC